MVLCGSCCCSAWPRQAPEQLRQLLSRSLSAPLRGELQRHSPALTPGPRRRPSQPTEVGAFLAEFGLDGHEGETIAYALRMQAGIRTLHDLRAVSDAALEQAGLDTMEQRAIFDKLEREAGGRLDW